MLISYRWSAMPLLIVLAFGQARGDDETDEVSIEMEGTLQAVNLAAVPPTIQVLGLTIDIGTAEVKTDKGDTAADLTVGQPVKVEFLTAATPLKAREVRQRAELTGESKIQAPIEAVDPSAQTVTLLGQSIDVSGAGLEGDDDDGDDNSNDSNPADDNQPITLDSLFAGQYVEVELDPAPLPSLVAKNLELKNFTNQIGLTVFAPDGSEVNDLIEDVEIEIECRVRVVGPLGRKVTRLLPMQEASKGSTTLAGFPTGKAKVTVTRTIGPLVSQRTKFVRIRGNRLRPSLFKLRAVTP